MESFVNTAEITPLSGAQASNYFFFFFFFSLFSSSGSFFFLVLATLLLMSLSSAFVINGSTKFQQLRGIKLFGLIEFLHVLITKHFSFWFLLFFLFTLMAYNNFPLWCADTLLCEWKINGHESFWGFWNELSLRHFVGSIWGWLYTDVLSLAQKKDTTRLFQEFV